MSENPSKEHVVIIGPDGQPVGTIPADALPHMPDGTGPEAGTEVPTLVQTSAPAMRTT